MSGAASSVGQNLDIVVEAHEADGLLVALIGKERKAQRPQQREDVHHEQHGDGWRDQKPAVVVAAIGIDHEGRGNHGHHGSRRSRMRRTAGRAMRR